MKPRLEIKRPSRCLLNGLRLAIRNWRCLLFACVIGTAIGLLAGSPLATKIAPTIAPRLTAMVAASLNSRQLSRPFAANLNVPYFNVPYFQELTHRWVPATHSAARNNWARSALALTLVGFTLLLFLLFIVAATLPLYFTEGPPRFRVLLKSGRGYFWRFARAFIFTAIVTVPLLAALIVLRALLLQHVSKIYLARTVFLYSAITGGGLLFAALLLLLWADLAEVYAVRNGMLGNPRARQALAPALRLLWRQFFWILPSFLLSGALGAGLLLASLLLWKALILSNHVWFAYVALQVGFLLLLTTRFWQRGMEAALVIAVEPSRAAAVEPTLQDLVLKLRAQPWAKPDSALLSAALFPEAACVATPPPPRRSSQESLLAEHAKKVTLLDALTEEDAPAAQGEPSDRFPSGADFLSIPCAFDGEELWSPLSSANSAPDRGVRRCGGFRAFSQLM